MQINVDKIAGDKVWLEIALEQQPRMSNMTFTGVKGGEKKDIEQRLGMVSGQQLTPNIITAGKENHRRLLCEKRFQERCDKITQQPDLSKENHVILNVDVNKTARLRYTGFISTATKCSLTASSSGQ